MDNGTALLILEELRKLNDLKKEQNKELEYIGERLYEICLQGGMS